MAYFRTRSRSEMTADVRRFYEAGPGAAARPLVISPFASRAAA